MLRALMIILPLALTIYAFIDCLNTPEDETKHLPKVVWVIVILLFWVVGPVVWLFAGKTRRTTARGDRGGWVAPDDNPEFLKSLGGERAQERKQRDEAPFDDGEADPRPREDDLKKREGRDEGGEEKDA
ncbi:hypothetical protein GCM10010363_57990 [Streptomyces omiyaensis]|uniref:PLD nuclease N-terminal domain-containing protein n=1 Tax=Streptomyces omiyaensis TaxID=68247 RepID=UPI00167A4864|nr:PLD nuclease N-terminal domain-containing protein [Streptomyces omiyaensis]GGY69184.1 hypothetical protein GCM10010363_57990 [Streptomyces omiyaensis]